MLYLHGRGDKAKWRYHICDICFFNCSNWNQLISVDAISFPWSADLSMRLSSQIIHNVLILIIVMIVPFLCWVMTVLFSTYCNAVWPYFILAVAPLVSRPSGKIISLYFHPSSCFVVIDETTWGLPRDNAPNPNLCWWRRHSFQILKPSLFFSTIIIFFFQTDALVAAIWNNMRYFLSFEKFILEIPVKWLVILHVLLATWSRHEFLDSILE